MKEDNKQPIVMAGITILLAIILFGALAVYVSSVSTDRENYDITSFNQNTNQTYLSPFSLSIGDNLTSSSVKVYNQTWLNFDGVNDYVDVTSSITNTTTFWYKNSTSSNWIFIANSSGTLYVNGSADTPVQYPVYYNGTDYLVGASNYSKYLENLVVHYKMNDNTTSKTIIDSKNVVNGTFTTNTSLRHIEGIKDGALNFNGSGDYIDTGSSFNQDDYAPILNNDFTFNMWVKHYAQTSTAETLLGAFSNVDSSIHLYVGLNNKFGFSIRPGNDELIYFEKGLCPINEWVMVTFSVQQTSTRVLTLSLFVNGKLNYSGTGEGTLSYYNDPRNIYIGAWNLFSGTTGFFNGSIDDFMAFNKTLSATEVENLYNNSVYNYFNGSIDDFRIYNSSLNSSQINQLYQNKSLTNEQNLTNFLKFNENSGTTTYDSSGNGNNGTISGATYQNDGILVSLVNGIDYTLSSTTGLLNVSQTYLYDWVMVDWSYETIDEFGFHVAIIKIITGVVCLIVLLVAAAYLYKLFGEEKND